MLIRFIALAILTEALVTLFFTAAPLQGLRRWLIKITPVLHIEAQGHLFECKYCISVWFAAGVILLSTYADYQPLRIVSYALIIGRLSNYCHLLAAMIRDKQINMRLER